MNLESSMLRLTTAGESHGPGITAILEGVPAGLRLDVEAVNAELRKRQGGYGRGGRQKIEEDSVEILAGLRKGVTTGAPLSLFVRNRDSRLDDTPELTAPRPGHADLAGHQATGAPIRDILERASARETAGRVAGGAVARQVLKAFGVTLSAHVRSIGPVAIAEDRELMPDDVAQADASPVRCVEENASDAMCKAIDEARSAGQSLGGIVEVVAWNMPAGVGSYAYCDRKLDARLASALVSIPAIKGVEIGPAFANTRKPGSRVHDEIVLDSDAAPRAGGFLRKSNRAGGIEGSTTNGMPVVVRAAMKPIPTMTTPLASVDIVSREGVPASKERSDVCAVPAASVVAEAMVALTLAEALLERLGTGGIEELKARLEAMVARMMA
jgi:chorismate synthase